MSCFIHQTDIPSLQSIVCVSRWQYTTMNCCNAVSKIVNSCQCQNLKGSKYINQRQVLQFLHLRKHFTICKHIEIRHFVSIINNLVCKCDKKQQKEYKTLQMWLVFLFIIFPIIPAAFNTLFFFQKHRNKAVHHYNK